MRKSRQAKRASRRVFSGLLGNPSLWLALALGGCAVGPDFIPPGAEVQENWIESGDKRVATHREVKRHWWRAFNDPTLDRLIECAYEQNLPVQVAGLRISRRARSSAWRSASCFRRPKRARVPRSGTS